MMPSTSTSLQLSLTFDLSEIQSQPEQHDGNCDQRYSEPDPAEASFAKSTLARRIGFSRQLQSRRYISIQLSEIECMNCHPRSAATFALSCCPAPRRPGVPQPAS